MAIKFLRDYEVQDESGKKYKEGQVVRDLSAASEAHFVTRDVAEQIASRAIKK